MVCGRIRLIRDICVRYPHTYSQWLGNIAQNQNPKLELDKKYVS